MEEISMEITQEMLAAAMKEAVKLKVFPKTGTTDEYMKCWETMRKILEAALNA
jgi:hypothetical protein